MIEPRIAAELQRYKEVAQEYFINNQKEQAEWIKKFLDDLTNDFFFETNREIARLAKRNDELQRENDNLCEDINKLQHEIDKLRQLSENVK